MSLPWYRRFRTKLVLSLFPILAGVTIASIWVAERRFIKVHQRLFEAQFQGQIEAFDNARARRFEAISERLEELAAAPALAARMKGELDGSLRQAIDPILREIERQRAIVVPAGGGFLSGGYRPGGGAASPRGTPLPPERRPRTDERGPGPPTSGGGEPRPPPSMATVMLLDASGQTISRVSMNPEEEEEGRPLIESERRRHTANFLRASNKPFSELLTGQEVGYAVIEQPGENRRNVREIFMTPIRDANGAFLGALVVGLPLPTFDERALFRDSGRVEGGQIMSGVWVDGHLISSTIPAASQDELSALMSQEMAEENGARGNPTLVVDGQRQRVIYRILNPDSPFPRAAQVNLYSLAALDSEIADLRITAAEIAGTAMLVALGLILFVSRGLSGPVSALTRATREIAEGRYDVRVPVRTRDEVGLLGRAFNDMTAGLAQRERYLSVLNAVADPAVASRLLHENTELGGVQKEVSVLFCDIRGFTALSERLPAPDVIDLLNQHMTAMTAVAYEHGGTVDKFVGDQLMVLFGAPEGQGDDAARAVRCALAMRQTRARLNEASALPLEVGIGIATGQVVAGCMGSEKRLSYTVIGHRVNLAARLCGLASAGQIVIDDTTRALLPASLSVTSLQPTRLKGISDPVQSHAVEGEVSAA